ncbi:MAG: MFS transporter [Nanoarchaeota archaeon]|nr:MFS transporter [Nanoarchaeota archaeon]
MNKTLKLLILSDVFILSGFGFVAPILAIFIKDNLVGGSIFSAGIATMIFLITHAVLQLVFAYKFHPKDRLWMLFTGTALITIVPILYIFSTHIYYIYLAEFIYGLGAAFAYPSWSSLFTSNLEKGKRGFQWSLHSSSVGIGTAITAGVGAFLAEKIGFELVFGITGLFSLAGFLILFKLEKKILKRT